MPTPFRIAIPDDRLVRVRERVAGFAWSALPDAGGWRSGIGIADLRRLCDRWVDGYDWREIEARLNDRPQFRDTIDGQTLHYVHYRGGDRTPVLLLHGWPGSFLEFDGIVDALLAHGHDVVVPSLPGFAFSTPLAAPIGPRRMAELMTGLMRALYAEARWLVQGGDFGAAIAAWMAHDTPERCAAIHLNMVPVRAADAQPEGDEEIGWAAQRASIIEREGGYFHQQSTRPQTLAVGLTDNPVGVAAWIVEKFGAWADVPRDSEGAPDLWRAFDIDDLLTNVMLYVATDAFPTSIWVYRGYAVEGSMMLPAGGRVMVPTAVAAFPDPFFPPPPRSLVERSYAVQRWTEQAAGGHFAAMEQPKLFAADLTAFLDAVEAGRG